MIANGKRLARLLLILVFLVSLGLYLVPTGGVYAAQITDRSLTLQAGVTDGGSKPSGVVNHLFSFNLPSSGTIGSILFQYCTTAANSAASPTCVTPHGLDTTAATLGTQSGATSFSLVNTTNGSPYLTRTAASFGGGAVSYQLLGVTNPDGNDCFGGTPPASLNCTFYVRISTYASTDTSGPATDTGTVAASISQQIVVTGIMPESLIFCTGATVGTTSSIPDCSTATSGAISFNQLFSPTSTSTTTSQMAASTNAQFGYAITMNGTTLTSGSNTITAMVPPGGLAVHGSSQFGINLRANTTATSTPAVGTDVTPAANGTNYRGEALSGYNSVDNFQFHSTDTVADSGNGGAGPTDAQIFTVTYIVNVPGSQPAGTYTTTLTYICTPTF